MQKILCCIAAVAILLTGCGASSKFASDEMATTTMSYNGAAMDGEVYLEEAWYEEAPAEAFSGSTAVNTGAEKGQTQAENDLSNRKLIRNASLNVETKAYDDFTAALEKQLATYGAYIQSGENTGSAERGNRWASYVIRVPADRYDELLSSVSALGNVAYKSENVQDVTMEYTDVEAKIRALSVEEETLLSILARCETVEDVISVQERISDVQYQLDSYQSRLRQYDNLISYCTVTLNVDEVEKVSIPVAEKTVGQRIREDLVENCEDIAEDAKDFAVWFVSSLPYFGIWIVVLGGVIVLAIWLSKRSKRKLLARQQKRQAEKQGQNDAEA